MSYKVVIVEDQHLPREFFKNIVSQSENYELVETFSSAKGTAEFVRTHEVDLILMDIVMGEGQNGLEASAVIKGQTPSVKILLVTQMPEVLYLKRAREIGVESFWYKDVVGQSLLDIMDRTMAGEHIYPDNPPKVAIGEADSSMFSEREMDVLRLLTTGISDQEIADELCISLPTVRTHIRNMTQKTGLSRVKLAIVARSTGIAIG